MIPRKEPGLPGIGFLLTLVAMLAFVSACSTPEDPQSVEPPPSKDFFPSLAVGDTIVWDYLYYDLNAGMLMDRMEGRMRWTVTDVDSAAGLKVTRLRQVFTGLLTKRRSDSPTVRDSIRIAADTTAASAQEDASHMITVTTKATGTYASYGGLAVSFPRYPTGVPGDTLHVSASYSGGGYGTTVRAKRAFGLVYYYDWAGPGMTQVRTSMTRR
jgi:hypothetical protein